ncbi:MAG: 2-oxoacid:acceptor oxidoreductase family protein [Candidatus Woesearchaeota archaeon]
MENIYEITIIGRGGQGAKTASEVLAGAALKLNKHIQAFSEYGAERTGAPILSYIRISDTPIFLHTTVTQPDLILIMDDTLTEMASPSPNTKIIINTTQSTQKIKQLLNFNGKVFTFDGTAISLKILGKNIPNTPALGAIAKVLTLIPKHSVEQELRDHLERKIGKEAMDRNIECLNLAYTELKEA